MYVCVYRLMMIYFDSKSSYWIKHSCVRLNHVSVCFEYLTKLAESMVTTVAGLGCQVATCTRGHISYDDISGYRANKLHLKSSRSS